MLDKLRKLCYNITIAKVVKLIIAQPRLKVKRKEEKTMSGKGNKKSRKNNNTNKIILLTALIELITKLIELFDKLRD